jgi:hypothetical protein
MLAYLDDWQFVASSVAEANTISRTVIVDKERAHVNINYAKSSLSPTTRITHLGFDIDTSKGMFTVRSERWRSAQTRIESLLGGRARAHTAREIASVRGKNISMGLALCDSARLHTRALFADIIIAARWGHNVAISPNGKEELLYWRNLPRDRFHGRIYPTKDETPTVFLECDASGIGWGGLCREGPDHP